MCGNPFLELTRYEQLCWLSVPFPLLKTRLLSWLSRRLPPSLLLLDKPYLTTELLILTWGICFIANTRGSEPTMKGRNFAKSLQRGSSKVIRKKRKTPSAPTHHDEERPQWDNDEVCISSDSESGEQVREREGEEVRERESMR